MATLYDDDILLWSERQADLLRRQAAGERVNSAELDWPNIAEEIEDVGLSSLRACRSNLFQALLHELKIMAWPTSREVPHWHSEARVARFNAGDAYAPSMRQRIDLPRIYAKAVRALPDTIDGQPPLPLPDVCPMMLDELMEQDELPAKGAPAPTA
jgi:hypothetical protein